MASIEIDINVDTIDKYIIQSISLDDVYKYGKDRFNSNNHWINGIKPLDYSEVSEKCSAHHWIHKFRKNYSVLNISKDDMPWLKKAAEIGRITGEFSHIFDDDLDDMLQKYDFGGKLFDKDSKYFVRTNEVSLKYGANGVGPYNNLKSIIESLVSSTPGHAAVHENTESITVYLLPWINIIDDKEFRVFLSTMVRSQQFHSKLYIKRIRI